VENLKKIREQKMKRRKNLLPTLILIFIFWGIIFFIIYFLDPEANGVIPLFFIILFGALLLSLSLIFANTRRGILYSTGLLIFMLLRYFGVGNILNLLLILGVTAAADFYLSKS